MKYDFGGYATRNDLTCSDGRVIKKDAFKAQNGQTVPLVWNHNHDDVNDVLGLAHLENRKDGVYAYCEFNDTDNGKTAKELVQHGDVKSLSIFANQLMQKGSDVIHGLIREVSLVLAGANPGAFIDDVIAHGEDGSGIIACYDEGVTVFMHSDDKPDDEEKTKDSEDKKKEKSEDDETVEDVLATLTEKQQTAVYAMIGAMTGEDPENNNDDSDDNEGGKEEMKHNVFENGAQAQDNTLSHADQVAILETAKMRTVGTFKNALQMYAEENALQHDATSSGVATGDLSKLFPEYAEVRPGAPELITNDQGWISTVISKVHKSPMSRIRTTQADSILCGILDCPERGKECRAYFQPPASVSMKYPAIVYALNGKDKRHADDRVYLSSNRYSVTVIDSNPDSDIVDKVSELPMCRFNTAYTKDNLNHTVYEIYY